jgi:hypothetical protein
MGLMGMSSMVVGYGMCGSNGGCGIATLSRAATPDLELTGASGMVAAALERSSGGMWGRGRRGC